MGTKFCGGCRLAQPVSEFHANRLMPDGLAKTCKGCVQAYWLRYAASKPDKLLRRNPVPAINRGWIGWRLAA